MLGVQSKKNKWFHNYLSSQQQQVQYNGGKSSVADLLARIGNNSTNNNNSNAQESGLEVGFSAYADDAFAGWQASRQRWWGTNSRTSPPS